MVMFDGGFEDEAPPPRRKSLVEIQDGLRRKGFRLQPIGEFTRGPGFVVTGPDGAASNRIGRKELEKVLDGDDPFFSPKRPKQPRGFRPKTFRARGRRP